MKPHDRMTGAHTSLPHPLTLTLQQQQPQPQQPAREAAASNSAADL